MPLISSPLTADFFISWKLRSYEMKNAAPALAFCGYGPEKRKKYGKKKRRTKKHPLEKHPQTGRAVCGGGSLPACGGPGLRQLNHWQLPTNRRDAVFFCQILFIFMLHVLHVYGIMALR